ncbi:MAG: hypothetical protein ACKOA8_02820, partial [Deltaproteobacteria bacterium]
DYQGVPRGDKKVKILETELIDEQNSRIYYSYEGTALLQSGPRTHNTFPLPRIPTQEGIFDPAVDEKGFNHATDPHYQDYDDYWYFWNPTRPGSRLKEGIHYDFVKADIQRIKRTDHSSPHYKKLVNSEGVIRVTAMFGMDDPSHSRNANRGKDLGALGYRGFRKGLLEMGFESTELSTSEKEKLFGGHKFLGFTLEKLTRETPRGKIEVLLFFGPSGISEPSRAFHYVFKDSLENSAVVLYDGHSGLGAHLDIDSIERAEGFKIQRHPKDYQIFFLNSCSSYSYYNLSYHKLKDAKNPTQYLDILTNGLETAFDETQKSNLALIKAVTRWATTGKEQSYQSLAKMMDAANLFAVNGDSDNKKDN